MADDILAGTRAHRKKPSLEDWMVVLAVSCVPVSGILSPNNRENFRNFRKNPAWHPQKPHKSDVFQVGLLFGAPNNREYSKSYQGKLSG
jgi:hypothetical protein